MKTYLSYRALHPSYQSKNQMEIIHTSLHILAQNRHSDRGGGHCTLYFTKTLTKRGKGKHSLCCTVPRLCVYWAGRGTSESLNYTCNLKIGLSGPRCYVRTGKKLKIFMLYLIPVYINNNTTSEVYIYIYIYDKTIKYNPCCPNKQKSHILIYHSSYM